VHLKCSEMFHVHAGLLSSLLCLSGLTRFAQAGRVSIELSQCSAT